MSASGWAKPKSGRKRHFYCANETRPMCGKNLHHVIGERSPGAGAPWEDCQQCVAALRRLR